MPNYSSKLNGPHPTDIHVGARLRILRKMKGVTQQGLVKLMGDSVTFQQLQKYENGDNRISASRLVELANALGVSPSYFFEGLPGVIAANADYIDNQDLAALIVLRNLRAAPNAGNLREQFRLLSNAAFGGGFSE